MGLIDSHGRSIDYLRLSITDRCSLRCRYCMPAGGLPTLRRSEILTFEELERIAQQAVILGCKKIRVTGGEPLVRKGVIGFLENIARIPGLKELALTTNGLLLRDLAADLYRAGVKRLNVSMDSLKPETYALITRGGDLSLVLDGIAAAEEAGFGPVKINVVVMRGINDDEILNFAALTIHKAHSVRFIEYMPTAIADGWESLFVSGREIMDGIRTRYSLETISHAGSAGPAREFRILGAAGTLGVITPVSNSFCQSCNRLRITAVGVAKGCLFGEGVSLKPYLRAGDHELRNALCEVVTYKPVRHEGLGTPGLETAPFAMAQIGG